MGEAHQGEKPRRRMERCFQIYCVCTSSRKLMLKQLLLPLRFKPIKGFEESYSVLSAKKNKRDLFSNQGASHSKCETCMKEMRIKPRGSRGAVMPEPVLPVQHLSEEEELSELSKS
ncbi:uncharacterized protein ACIB01_011523 [Guaruba guarouba]